MGATLTDLYDGTQDARVVQTYVDRGSGEAVWVVADNTGVCNESPGVYRERWLVSPDFTDYARCQVRWFLGDGSFRGTVAIRLVKDRTGTRPLWAYRPSILRIDGYCEAVENRKCRNRYRRAGRRLRLPS